jgi:tryptophan-rich sensory protein
MKYVLVASPYEILGLFPFLAFSYLSAYYTSGYTRNKEVIKSYNQLKAPMRPPPWVFTAIWTILCALNGFAGFYVWQKLIEYKVNGDTVNKDVDGEIGNDVIYWQYITILFLHVSTWFIGPIWFKLFFDQKRLAAALGVIILNTLIVITILVIGYIMDWVVGLLYTPYCVWMIMATALNAMFYYLN